MHYGCAHRASTFAKFCFGYSGPPCKIRNKIKAHSVEEGHRIATVASRRSLTLLPAPAAIGAGDEAIALPVAEASAADIIAAAKADVVEDRQLLKGRVPQAQDWLRCWAEATEKIAFRKQIRLAEKKGEVPAGGGPHLSLRKTRRKQVRVMAEAHREVIRERLGQAQYISLSMDEREYIKVIRYRCDAPCKPYVHRGILGVMDCGKTAPGDFEEDHALMAVRKLDSFFACILHSHLQGRPAVGDGPFA